MNEPKRPVSIDDLLHLKRAERPAPEFWNEFDRQLRAKQLAALVEKRPWWHGLRESVLRVGRYHVAAGAAAALTVVVISNREKLFHEAPTSGVVATQEATQAPLPLVSASGGEVRIASSGVDQTNGEVLAVERVVISTPAGAVRESSSESRLGLVTAARSESTDALSAVEAITGALSEEAPASPSARFIAANFAAAQAADSAPVTVFASAQGFESRAMPARGGMVIDPLQNVALPGEARRSPRFLAAMVSFQGDSNAGRATEKVANRISQEELYEQVRRFGTRQGGFNMKF